jgi:type II secretion system protein I
MSRRYAGAMMSSPMTKGYWSQRKKVTEGFTLMEVMIAMAILAIILVAAFQSQSQSLSMAGRSRFLTTASLLAQSRMAEIEMVGIENLTINSGDFGAEYPDYTWRVEIADTPADILKKVTVRVINGQLIANNDYTLVYYTLVKK